MSSTMRMESIFYVVIFLGLIPASLAQCPVDDPCSCFQDEDGGTVINCRSKGLRNIPSFKPTSDSFSLLSLANNEISSIGHRAFYTTGGEALNVRRIDLEGNSITTVHDDAFTGMSAVKELLLGMSGDTFPAAVSDLSQLQVLGVQGLHITRLPSQVLQPLTSLRRLALVSCSLDELGESDLSGQKNSLEELDLKDNSLTELPTAAFDTLTNLNKLNLDANHMTSLPADGFSNMKSLKELILSRNTLQTIHSNAFRGLEETLQNLELFYCRLHDNNLQPLARLWNLLKLKLDNNEGIQRIPTDLFRDMNQLQELRLHTCSLTSINQDTFRGVEGTLQYLDLASNDITAIAPFTFQQFSSLQTLLLNINDLQTALSTNTFHGLQNTLQLLNLEGTNMKTDNLKAVSYLTELHTLKLSSNSIQSLPDYIFTQLSKLKVLEVNTNSLSNVRPAAMFGLRDSLKTINLKGNQISTISHCTFKDFSALETIYFLNNPLMCDCHARWLREWLDQYNAFDRNQIKWECAGPAPHTGHYVKDIDAQDFVCSHGEEIEECEILTTPTPPNFPDSTIIPSEGVLGLQVNVTNVTKQEIMLVWRVFGGGVVTNFLLEAKETSENDEEAEPAWKDFLDAESRNATVDGLLAGTMYTVCVTAYFSPPTEHQHAECVNATTAASSQPVVSPASRLAIIVGSVLGVAVFLILLVIVIVVVRRTTSTHPYKQGGLPESRADLPTMGYNSKRFSKPRSTMTSVAGSREDLERKLDGFTPEERNRILQLLSSSTLSLASAGSTRYLDEPRPHRWTGGASAYYNEEDPYHEIPQGDAYEYIPADQVTKYDYIPADQVQRPAAAQASGGEKSPPPLPPPHPESSAPPTLSIRDSLSQSVPPESPHTTHDTPSSEWI